MTTRKHNEVPEKIHEALELLNEAAKEKRGELFSALENQYEDFMKTLTDVSSSIKERTDHLKRRAEATLQLGQKKIEQSVTEAAENLDENVRQHPWAVLGSVALGTFLLGYGLSRKRKKEIK